MATCFGSDPCFADVCSLWTKRSVCVCVYVYMCVCVCLFEFACLSLLVWVLKKDIVDRRLYDLIYNVQKNKYLKRYAIETTDRSYYIQTE